MFRQTIVNSHLGNQFEDIKKHPEVYMQIKNINAKRIIGNLEKYLSKVFSSHDVVSNIITNQVTDI